MLATETMSESNSSSLILRRKIAFSCSYLYTESNPVGYGHNFTFEVFLKGSIDPKTGLVVNLTDVKPFLKQTIALLDHKNLKMDLNEFKERQNISEADILKFILQNLKGKIPNVELVGGRLYYLDQFVEKLI